MQGNNPITIAIMLLSSSIQSVNHPPSLSPLSPHPNEISRDALRFISIHFSSSTTRANSLVRSLHLKERKDRPSLETFQFQCMDTTDKQAASRNAKRTRARIHEHDHKMECCKLFYSTGQCSTLKMKTKCPLHVHVSSFFTHSVFQSMRNSRCTEPRLLLTSCSIPLAHAVHWILISTPGVGFFNCTMTMGWRYPS